MDQLKRQHVCNGPQVINYIVFNQDLILLQVCRFYTSSNVTILTFSMLVILVSTNQGRALSMVLCTV